MKTVFLPLFFFFFSIAGHACSCIYISDYFCPSVSWINGNGASGELHIAMVKVESVYGYYMDVQVVDNLQNTLPDTALTILGQDGLNCNEWLGHFEADKTFILALSKSSWEEGVYDLSGCGRFWLPVIEENVQGYIAEGVNEQSYDAFKQGIAQCAGLTPAGEPAPSLYRLFPNPTAGELYIDGPLHGEAANYSLYSSAGQLVKTGSIRPGSSPTLSLAGLPEGLYLLRLLVGEAILTRRVVLSFSE